MDIQAIRSREDHCKALARIDELWGADPGTPEGKELDVLIDLVEHYEDRQFPIEPVEPIEFLIVYMKERNIKQSDFAKLLGSSSRASEVLRKKRALTMDMVHKLHENWHIPADILVRPYQIDR